MLDKFLRKLGVSSYNDLNEEEKNTFKEWEIALSGRKLTDTDVKKWLDQEYEVAVTRATEEGLSEKIRDFRSVEVRFIKKVINLLNSPSVEKQFAEKAIEQLMKENEKEVW